MKNDEGLEETRRADPPRLVFSRAVVGVQKEDGDDVAGRESDWNFPVQEIIVELRINAKRTPQ